MESAIRSPYFIYGLLGEPVKNASTTFMFVSPGSSFLEVGGRGAEVTQNDKMAANAGNDKRFIVRMG